MATGRTSSSTPSELRGACITSSKSDSFLIRLEHATRKLVDNAQFMNALLAKLDRLESQSVDGTQQQQQQDEALSCASILDSSV